jgi:ketosteroid isomerase-like protein
MSQRNVEIVRASMDAWNRGDWDAALAAVAPDIVIDASGNAGEWRGVHRGKQQLERLWEAFVEPWESVRVEIEECIDAGEHVVTRQSGRFLGRDGIEVQAKTGWCWTFRDGLVTHLLAANDFEEALEAAGIGE